MTWRYDVFECNNETTDHHLCEVMTGPPARMYWGDGWKDAYRKAEELPHAIVSSSYRGRLGYGRTPHTVFEHIEGGGVCKGCAKRSEITGQPLDPASRGPLVKTPFGNVFMCDSCRAAFRSMHVRNTRDPDKRLYVPIIETIDF